MTTYKEFFYALAAAVCLIVMMVSATAIDTSYTAMIVFAVCGVILIFLSKELDSMAEKRKKQNKH